jgi:hypothetical protein
MSAADAIRNCLPVRAATSTSLLVRIEPPPGVLRLRIYADRDEPGPRQPFGSWNGSKGVYMSKSACRQHRPRT